MNSSISTRVIRMSDDEHRLANAEPPTQPADLEQSHAGGTGVKTVDLEEQDEYYMALRALDEALENFPGEPDGEVRITVTVTDK